jgi:hypothetical protein
MRKSRAVPIATLSALALAFGACGDDEEETAYCVDNQDRVVENENCDEEARRGGGGVFFWMFGSGFRGNRIPQRGERITGERISPNDRAALQSKGGFGSNARGGGIGRTVSAGG